MSMATITRDDFGNAARSYVVVGVVVVFASLVALVFAAEYGIYDDAFRTLWDVSALVGFMFPLFLAPLTYLAVAGDRESGTIKYVLGLPNSRRDYFLGKFVSRFGVAAAAVVLGLAAGFVVAAATYVNVPDLWRFAAFAGVSLLYAFALTGLFLAISAATSTRSRAMVGVFFAYFVLVFFWFDFLPFINLTTALDAIEAIPGVSLSETARSYVQVVSPLTAYFQSSEVVYGGVKGTYDVFAQFGDGKATQLYERPWFAMVLLVAWGVGSLAVGYARFARSELG